MNSERPVVAFISDAEEFAGAEHYMVLILEALSDRFDFILVAGDHVADETVDKAAAAGARTIKVEGLRRRPSPAAIVRLARVLRQSGPALVHLNATDQGDAIAAFAASRFDRAPLLVTLHNMIPGRAARRERLSRSLLRRTDQVIAVSDGVGGYLGREGIRHAVVKNGLMPPQLDRRARERLGLDSHSFVVGGIGRLHEQKGWDVLCAAAPMIKTRAPEVRISVVGDGPLRDRLKRVPGADEVRFHGYLPDASSLLGAFDLLVIPSRYEGLGLVAIEGMLAGIPIVATSINGLSEALGDAARLVPPDQPRLLADAVVEMIGDPGQREYLVKRAGERARRLFHRDRMAEQTAAVYESLLGVPVEAGI
ncbi:MAG: hypothetical protein QOH23_2147 [Gaiellaceae bacterium]|jgi:glycosyltransferase involved in cell wall biosynthesis|nr:hypothetical protein [Gaiellaceae bacterium]